MPPKQKSSLGKTLQNDQKQKKLQSAYRKVHVTDFVQSEKTLTGKSKSVIERSALDDYLVTGLASQQDFSVLKQRELINLNVNRIVKVGKNAFNADKAGVSYDVDVPIPRRPLLFVGPNATDRQIAAPELDELEKNSFLNWRKEVARLEEEGEFVLTPFERNLEFWRQLWRVIEKSDVVAQVLDARNPLFYRCRDTERYVREVDESKKAVVIINKSDFLTRREREDWVRYFQKQGIDVMFFSAIREQFRLGQFVPAELDGNTNTKENTIGFGNLDFEHQEGDMADILDCTQLLTKLCESAGKPCPTIGMIGFPNVGKSSLINALCGEKKVSVSRQPGKTKHFQTLNMEECTLCDCPGLVFPSVVATRSHLIINGVMPIDHFKGDICDPAQLICDRTSGTLPNHFGITTPSINAWRVKPNVGNPVGVLDARGFLTDVAEKRKYFAAGRGGLADMFRTTKLLLKDYCSGRLLHCEPPPFVTEAGDLSIPVDSFRKEQAGRYHPGGMPVQPGDEIQSGVTGRENQAGVKANNNFGGIMKLPDAKDVGANQFGISKIDFKARGLVNNSDDSDSDNESRGGRGSDDEDTYSEESIEAVPYGQGPTRNVGGGDMFSNLMNRVNKVQSVFEIQKAKEKATRRLQRIEDGMSDYDSSLVESDDDSDDE